MDGIKTGQQHVIFLEWCSGVWPGQLINEVSTVPRTQHVVSVKCHEYCSLFTSLWFHNGCLVYLNTSLRYNVHKLNLIVEISSSLFLFFYNFSVNINFIRLNK